MSLVQPIRRMNQQPHNSHPTDSTSLSLLRLVKAEDQAAWQRLVDLYGPLVVHWCRRRNLHDADIADVVQNVFASVAANLTTFRKEQPGDTFRGWVRVITRNQINMHFRQQADREQAAGGSTAHWGLQQMADEQPADAATDDHDKSGLYRSALELIRTEFEEKTWKAFVQTAIEGRSTADVAADLGISAGAVRQAKYKVLRRLRSEFSDVIE